VIAIQRILFPTDFSDYSVNALKYARSFAEKSKAELHVLNVVDEAALYWMAMGPNSLPVGPSPQELQAQAQKEMTAFIEKHLGDTSAKVIPVILSGRPFIEIITYARQNAIDLIVIATHGRTGLQHVLLGSVTEKVIRKAPCPVLSVRHPGHQFVMP
jgi:nucleotide-binding universal stress UspA family protein